MFHPPISGFRCVIFPIQQQFLDRRTLISVRFFQQRLNSPYEPTDAALAGHLRANSWPSIPACQ
jgi:hypothetical protein